MNDTQRALVLKHGTLVGRTLLGALFLITGLSIVFGQYGVTGFAGSIDKIGLPLAGLIAWVIVLIKIVAGASLILGYRVGCSAGALIIFTALTIVFVHNNLTQLTMALKNLAIIGGLLYVMAYGTGNSWCVCKKSASTVGQM